MELWLAGLTIFVGLLVLLALGLEIAVALGGMGVLALVLFTHYPLLEGARIAWGISNSFVLTAVPMFIFMGEVFYRSRVTDMLFEAATKWLGWLPGGLACSVVGSCAIFAAISGSSVASAATMGVVALPEMKKRRYDMSLACGVIAAGGTLGILIPPSINMLIYGAWQSVSVPELYAGGIIPGIILSGLFIIYILAITTLKPRLAPERVSFSWRERLVGLGQLAPWLVIIFIVLGGIFAGIMTPTEAAGVGALLAIVTALAYRRLTVAILRQSARGTVQLTGMILFIVAGASVYAFFVQYSGIAAAVSNAIVDLPVSKYVTISLIWALYFLLGMFFDALSMMLLTLPVVAPVVTGLGFDLVWFGVILVVTMEAGLITPPVGMNLFVVHGVARGEELSTIILGAAPFLIPMVILIALLTGFHQLILWMPKVLVG